MTVSVKAPTSTTGSIQLNGSDVLTIDSSGNLTAPNGLTVTGTTTNTGAITSTGGIYLGGTASANLLNDYEEGTWTPVITDGTNNVSTYYYQTGKYVKVGDMVFITVYTSINSKGSISGNLKVTGLPFTTNPGSFANRFILPCYTFSSVTRLYDFIQVNHNSTEFELRAINTAGTGTVPITGTSVGAGSQFGANFHYRTT